MKIFSIYKATNKINSKIYIGFDSNWPNRRWDHNRKTPKTNSIFHRAITKYGKEAFEWEVIYQTKDGNHCLNKMETHFIKEYNSFKPNGYNMTLGGDGQLGRTPTQQQRKKMSISHKNVKLSDYHKNRISESHKGKIPKNCEVKEWVVTYPTKKIETIINVNKFCKENSIPSWWLYRSSANEKPYYGWQCRSIENHK